MVQIKHYILFLLFVINSTLALTQIAPDKYCIYFTDKANSGFSTDTPEDFLSDRAILRRQKQNILISTNDLPLAQTYVDSVESFGITVLNKSKWLNCVTVEVSDLSMLDSLIGVSFIKQIKNISVENSSTIGSNKFPILTSMKSIVKTKAESELDYGQADGQITMLNGHILHNLGFQGEGMLIAITDGGFYKADVNTAFDSLRINNQIKITKNFVHGGEYVYGYHEHGAQVLSIIAANKPGQIIGTAPKADYLLLLTEDVSSEYRIEEYNWISAAEYADSCGADVINVSLGYNTFTDTDQNYTYSDMDGETSIISTGADIAASKGMLVVCSAGNEGYTSWHFIATPADADSVLTVGAVDGSGIYASLSSTGPTYDGRIKPNIVAQGSGTTYYSSSEYVSTGNGTSFSAPIISGLVACFWQANPSLTNMEIIDYIERSASQYLFPDSLLGHGIPDFALANLLTNNISYNDFSNDNLVSIFPNPFNNDFVIDFYSADSQTVFVQIFDMLGKLKFQKEIDLNITSYNRIKFDDADSLESGIYYIKFTSSTNSFIKKIIKKNS
ncbi:MAG TPA: peptidase S8 [Bacteroidales bacterium]|nr:MAG: hypothetical protein A2W98_06925 [Bacteroidetes bacterium GWF2_33_38]OFY76175.1 MAG: hypothetical protein A2265_09595 [Bacteroidetes bacterium RIFOXYA12_FULL_33_9]HBF88109.1 peptidase S8 [Bacteroidales bacterium]